MPKIKRGPRSTPPPMTIVIKDVPYVVAAKPEVKSNPAPASVNAVPKPHYY